MLSDEEKERIRAEEIYRKEVQKELIDKPKRSGNVVFSFLDTQHGLFVSSMVVLPFLLWFFAFIQNSYSEYEANQKLIRKIDNEMVYRISNNQGRLESGDVAGFIEDVDRSYIYQEFSGVGVQGLMLQLESLVSESDQEEIIVARNSLLSREKSKIESSLRIRGWSK